MQKPEAVPCRLSGGKVEKAGKSGSWGAKIRAATSGYVKLHLNRCGGQPPAGDFAGKQTRWQKQANRKADSNLHRKEHSPERFVEIGESHDKQQFVLQRTKSGVFLQKSANRMTDSYSSCKGRKPGGLYFT